MLTDTSQISIINSKCEQYLRATKDESFDLIVTSPPYNVGKEYEDHATLEDYLDWQSIVIEECVRVLKPTGSICWQVGNTLDKSGQKSEVIPLDCAMYPLFKKHGLQLRNRIVWTFEHGLHCKNRFSGRHETILWWTKSDDYVFNLDPVRVPQKYPGKKHFKGPNKGELSGNPLGKNPSDIWSIPNVKHNHVEKTDHPCQFPVELIGTLILSLSNENDLVLDPFAGVCTTGIAAAIHKRRCVCIEAMPGYADEGNRRLSLLSSGMLKVRSAKWQGI